MVIPMNDDQTNKDTDPEEILRLQNILLFLSFKEEEEERKQLPQGNPEQITLQPTVGV